MALKIKKEPAPCTFRTLVKGSDASDHLAHGKRLFFMGVIKIIRRRELCQSIRFLRVFQASHRQN